VSTAELEALGHGSRVRDSGGAVWRKVGRLWMIGTTGMSSSVLAGRNVTLESAR
jgi:hypothetical protein